MACATLLEPSYEEGGWLNYIDKRPRQDLVLQFRRARSAEKPFTAVPRELPHEFNAANLYWRLTGIAKEQIEAARRHRLAMDLVNLNRGTVGAAGLSESAAERVSQLKKSLRT
jgi:hypothetical protein